MEIPKEWTFENASVAQSFNQHVREQLPWYDLPEKYENAKENYLARNRHYHYRNYHEIFAAYFFKRKDDVPHPLYPWKD